MWRETVELLLHVSYIIYGVSDSTLLMKNYFLIYFKIYLSLNVLFLDKIQCKNANFSMLKYWSDIRDLLLLL